MLACLTASAQTDTPRQIYNQAESEYNIGRTEQAFTLLQNHMDSFEGDLRQSVLRLMALCCLSEDRDEEARLYAGQLIKLNNFYNDVDDPARFQDLIKQLKGGVTATITTASSQSESVNEAPSPVTIITADMIEELGYNKNLNQILAAYVPGMAEVTSLDEINSLSMHSAYAMGQELILIMENGLRLNSRYDNSGTTCYSISTEKIDHIEVLRGPASSLYGNVALSAVVNIITKSGKSLNGIKAKYGYANFGTHKADLTIGTQFMNADIFVWGSIYKSDGQIRHYSDGDGYFQELYKNNIEEYGNYKTINIAPDIIYVEGYKDTPAYDIGLTFKLKGFDLMFSKKSYKKVQIVSDYFGGYDYDRYYPINDIKPGRGNDETHAEIAYTQLFKNIQLSGSAYADWYSYQKYVVNRDSVVYIVPLYDYETNLPVYDEDGNLVLQTNISSGVATYSTFRERTIGGMFKASSPYRIGDMNGNLLAGVQYEHFSMLSRSNLWITNFEQIDGSLNFHDIIEAGNEKILSFFIQDKHYFTPQLILNAGLRYDLKYRQKEDVVRSFSPRLAMVYVPNDRFSMKLSYSEAYADLSFFYRYVSGSEYVIEPQHLSAIQLTASGTIRDLHLNYEANLFYNKYKNLLCWSPRDISFEEADIGINYGQLSNIGIEGSANYSYRRLSAYLSFYLSKDTDSKHYYYNAIEKVVNSVPHLTLNLHGAWKLIERKRHEVKVYGHSSYIGRKLNFQPNGEDLDYWMDAKILFDLGVKYCYNQRLQVSLDCENIFDTYNYICGPSYQSVPIFQRGRTLMASISYHI